MASGITSLVSRSRPPPRPYLSNTSSSRLPPPCRRLHPAARRARSDSTRIRCVATVKSKIRVHWFRCATISSDERCILAACVAPPSNTGGILGRRALPTRRLTRLDATPGFHHVLLGRQEPGIGTLASYDWLDLSTPEGYDRLVERQLGGKSLLEHFPIIPVNMKTSLARIGATETALLIGLSRPYAKPILPPSWCEQPRLRHRRAITPPKPAPTARSRTKLTISEYRSPSALLKR